MNRDNKRENIAYTEIATGLDQNISQADPLLESGLKMLHKVRSSKQTGQKRELERLKKKLGEKHSRVFALSINIEAEQALIRDIAVNIERTQIETPIINENTWVLHGLVYSKEMIGVPNLTVGLYDQKGKWLDSFGYVCTDKKGYFSLTHEFPPETSTELNESSSDTVSSKRLPQIFIRLQDKTGVHIYVGKQPVIPAHDQVQYREIILGDDTDTCIPPETSDKPPISSTKKPRSKRSSSRK